MSDHRHDHRKSYKIIWATLLVLTVITVVAAYYDLGSGINILVAIFIATVKATLVCLYFMHLKYDNLTNRVAFVSSFVFLAIFVALTASDELARPVFVPAKVEAVEPPAAMQAGLMEQLRTPSPELINKGKALYAVQCTACHGLSGKGDGPAGAALNPKPRDFTSGEWKQGGTPSQVFATLTKGIAGTAMAPYETLSIQDRWALVHYVRSLSPKTPEDTPETLAASGMGAKGDAPAKPAAQPELPVDFAIDLLVKEAQPE